PRGTTLAVATFMLHASSIGKPRPDAKTSREESLGTTRLLGIAVGLGLIALAALSPARVLDPFQNPFRLRVIEPREGASVSEGAVRVVAELEPSARTTPPPQDATPTPKPRIEIFLDNEAKGSPKEGKNTVVLEGVGAGTHTLLVTISDPSSGAVVERKEIHFTALPPPPQ
ncbi:MAG: hypothetical protein ACRD16_15160, partial [Thermoanaerobaculia bacterium]